MPVAPLASHAKAAARRVPRPAAQASADARQNSPTPQMFECATPCLHPPPRLKPIAPAVSSVNRPCEALLSPATFRQQNILALLAHGARFWSTTSTPASA